MLNNHVADLYDFTKVLSAFRLLLQMEIQKVRRVFLLHIGYEGNVIRRFSMNIFVQIDIRIKLFLYIIDVVREVSREL